MNTPILLKYLFISSAIIVPSPEIPFVNVVLPSMIKVPVFAILLSIIEFLTVIFLLLLDKANDVNVELSINTLPVLVSPLLVNSNVELIISKSPLFVD